MKKRGFTLIEIAVVVLVIAILAAAALPQYRKSLERSRAAEAFDILTEIRNKQEARDLLGTGTAKGYTVKFSDLGEVIAGKNSTTNTLDTSLFTYTLSNNPYPQAYAKRKDMDYSIVQTKGYQDSALCCLGRDCKVVDSVLKGCEKTACLTTCATGYKKTGYFFSEDGPCCEAKTSCPTTCPTGQKRSSVQYTEDGACCVAKTSCPTTCPTGQQRTSVQYSEDGACCVSKTSCPATCPAGQKRSSVQYTEDGACCVAKTSCPTTCPAGEERTSSQYYEDGACCKTATVYTCSGASSQACGNCGTQTRTCDTSTGTWSAWSSCSGEGVCSPGATQSCTGGTQTCSSTCAWGSCEVVSKSCSGASTQTCGKCGTQTRTCDTTTGVWSDWGSCSGEGECIPGEKRDYGCGSKSGTNWAVCGSDCKMGEPENKCSACEGKSTQSCTCNGIQTRTCNESTGTWSAWGACEGGQNPSNTASTTTKCSFNKTIRYSYGDMYSSSTGVAYTINGTKTKSWNKYTCQWQESKCSGMIWVSLGQPAAVGQGALCRSTQACSAPGTGWTYVGGSCNGSSLLRCSSSPSDSCYLYNCQNVSQ
ncbi:Type II secretion system subunit [Elusimicrobium minutum Pei191]|uniref:Type II secretion system subunit n=1 Tax=Elusimicrobium minutum (strain Pei191) TaxID=445932 RepID=B2KCB8_ELUMP|nr:prepilin-type N-terminal cleavage/methylation domain-containing protein [Elusimicrobium minutum]ACC98039.1 Type II secretion system subunit [Elusimicrobium minutum Pei191]